jgi:hypothetical protein
MAQPFIASNVNAAYLLLHSVRQRKVGNRRQGGRPEARTTSRGAGLWPATEPEPYPFNQLLIVTPCHPSRMAFVVMSFSVRQLNREVAMTWSNINTLKSAM